jgi:hypothetical protein
MSQSVALTKLFRQTVDDIIPLTFHDKTVKLDIIAMIHYVHIIVIFVTLSLPVISMQVVEYRTMIGQISTKYRTN